MSIKKLLHSAELNREIEVCGWLRTRRDSSSFSFLELNDGSCLTNLQIIADRELENYDSEVKKLSVGCALRVQGELKASPAKGQAVELHAAKIKVVGWADAANYPLQKKRHSFEFLRSISHLRPRTNALAAVARLRSHLNFAVHNFFHARSFQQIHTPVITTSDCEGAGEMFTVTALEPEQCRNAADFKDDFFGRRAGLTVSGQLQAEVYAQALGRVYTFGPTFRAENSNTSRHLAEFWMVEPEMAFCDLRQNMDLAEELVRELVQSCLRDCEEDLALFNKFIDKDLKKRLQRVVDKEFIRISYSEAVDRLTGLKNIFEFPVSWGIDLHAEHERYLCEKIFDRPVIISDYPKEIKPFYMRCNDDNHTVAAMDMLVPGIGELIGGSQREERYDVLLARMQNVGLDINDYQWYLDLRRFGSTPHAGFGLGFERMVLFVTGMKNIRDVIPFPRTPRSAPC